MQINREEVCVCVCVWCWKGEIIAPESKNETKHWPNIETPTQGEDKKSERENKNDKEQSK